MVENDTPGPGQYNPRITDRDHAVPELIHEARFAASGDWIDRSKEELPAPDSYQNVQITPGERENDFAPCARRSAK